MRTIDHQRHITDRVSHNDCQECRADCERQFLREQWPGYRYVNEYLNWIKPRLTAIREGNNSVDARQWKREFIRALHRRISLKTGSEQGRKYNSGYRERLRMALSGRNPNAVYLRRFATRGASTLR